MQNGELLLEERECTCKDNFVTQLVCGRTKDREWKGGFE